MNGPLLIMMLNPMLMQMLGNMQHIQNMLIMQKIMQHLQKRENMRHEVWSRFEAEVWLRF